MRRTAPPAALAALVVVGLVLGLVLLRAGSRYVTSSNDRSSARAKQRAAATAEDYARAVVAEDRNPASLSDVDLDRLRGSRSISWVAVLTRDRDLGLLVRAWADYPAMPFGSQRLHACFLIDFHDLGEPGARYVLEWSQICPTTFHGGGQSPSPPAWRSGA